MRMSIPGGVTRCAAVLGLSVLGCGPSFDPPSELHSLRVLAVQKDLPYAQPGDTVHLQMLWEDASSSRPRHIQVAWSPPCFDPDGDLYYGCFADSKAFSGELTLDSDTTKFTVPTNIISRRPVADGSKNATYGITYLFFAICAGTMELAPPGSAAGLAFPIVCKDASGKVLGADDFVAGYTAVYSFQSFSNHNPVISGFSLNGKALNPTQFCLDDACLPLAGSTDPVTVDCTDPAQSELCIPACADDGASSCKGYGFHPLLDESARANQDEDDVSASLLGRHVGEQMWIDYYAEQGSVKSPVRLLNDATAGWNADYGTLFYAPKEPGPVRIWAVAHDNRGGASWAGITLQVQ